MVNVCTYCGVRTSPGSGRTFHANPQKMEMWIKASGLEAGKITKWSRLCSDHFEHGCFPQGLGYNINILVEGAVPTIFGDRASRCVYCGGNRNRANKRSLHRFPFAKPEILNKWLARIPIPGFVPSPISVLCSDHFETCCFFKHGSLRPNAVPAIFLTANDIEPRDLVGEALTSEITSLLVKEEPLLVEEEPLLVEEEPLLVKEEPFLAKEEPLPVKEESLPVNEVLLTVKEEPLLVSQELLPVKEEAIMENVSQRGGLAAAEGSAQPKNLPESVHLTIPNVMPEKGTPNGNKASQPGDSKSFILPKMTPKNLKMVQRSISSDHCYEDTPRTTRKKLDIARRQLVKLHKEQKNQKQKMKRMAATINNLEDIVNTLRGNSAIYENTFF